MPRIGLLVLALAVFGHPRPSDAQSVSVAFGSHFRTDYSRFSGPVATLTGLPDSLWAFDLTAPVAVASVQLPVTRSLLFEGDFLTARTNGHNASLMRIVDGRPLGSLRASDCVPPRCTAVLEQDLRESRSTLGVGGNILLRAGTPRLGLFVGGGVGVQRTTGQLEATRLCQAAVAGGCVPYPDQSSSQPSSRVTLAPRLLYGAEVFVAPRLAAFVTFRWGGLGADTTYDVSDFPGTSFTGGLRVGLRGRPAGTGLPDVTVTETNGTKHRGGFVAMTPDAVVLRTGGRDLRLALDRVRTVDKVGRHALIGALAGTAYASAAWLGIAATRDTCADCEDGPLVATVMTPVAIGAGAGIGALIERATRGGRRLYPVQARSSMRIAPVIHGRLAGASLRLMW